jgi:hypothetical protein
MEYKKRKHSRNEIHETNSRIVYQTTEEMKIF